MLPGHRVSGAPVLSVVGSGVPSFRFPDATGIARHFRTPGDVLASINDDLESVIAVVASGGTTFLSPILGRLGGIVALDGTLRSHLAIVSREFEVPCLVNTSFETGLVDGDEIQLSWVDADRATVATRRAES